MGWFDESDDENDNEQATGNEGIVAKESSNGGGDDNDDDDDEDPLDAYMKSLESTAPATSASSTPSTAAAAASSSSIAPKSQNASNFGGRLDHDAEEEATSHWGIDRDESSLSRKSDVRLLPKAAGFDDADAHPDAADNEHGGSFGNTATGAREARSAMSSTFVRAVGIKSRGSDIHTQDHDNNSSNNNNASQDLDEDDDYYNDSSNYLQKQQQKHDKQQQSMLHQEIDPLDKINHAQIKYLPFRRQFYIPPDTEAGHAWRREHEVICNPGKFDPILGFGELDEVGNFDRDKQQQQQQQQHNIDNIDNNNNSHHHPLCPPELLKTIAKQGYDSPTPVQSQTLPVALSGKDALITASTGSGKTLSYIWPLVIHISDQPHIHPGVDGPIGIILTPTRELAKQVYKYAKIFIECIGGKVVEVAGGNKGTWELTKELKKGCEVVVGTPGRVIDVVKKKGTNLRRVTYVVLDEGDRMLDMGFEKQVSSILENIRPDRQTLLLSATFGKRVEKVARSWLRDPVRIAIGRTGASSEHVDQHAMVVPSRDSKIQWLVEMLPILSPLGRCLVFVATRADCDFLAKMIQNSPSFAGGTATATNNTVIVSIHGDKDQRDRNSAIAQFKKQSQAILIATDVASRGLDIPDVVTVINFDAAKNIDSHVHRVGRAGRLSKDRDGNDGVAGGQHQRGVAYTLLTEKDSDFAQSLVEAFEREGRAVSQELVALCQKSKRYGGGRAKHSKDGLGFGGGGGGGASNASNNSRGMASTASAQHSTQGRDQGSGGGSYYGPTSGPPTAKRSRWS